MEISESAQEMLELLWAREHGEPKPKTSEIPDKAAVYGELEELGLGYRKHDTFVLTEKGTREAALAIRRHRLAERLLHDVVDTADQLLDEQACRLEHVLMDGLDDSICTLLGHPRYCPHGNPIPKGECCLKKLKTVGRLLVPLTDMRPGQQGQIAYIQMGNEGRMDKILAMGIFPGSDITLIRRHPSFVFRTGHSQFAVDQDIAAEIYVRLKPDNNK